MPDEKSGFSKAMNTDKAKRFVSGAAKKPAPPGGSDSLGTRSSLQDLKRLAALLVSFRPEDCCDPAMGIPSKLELVFEMAEVMREIHNCSQDARMMAERLAGRLLAELWEHRLDEGGLDAMQTMADLGISRVQSERYKALGNLSSEGFDELICRMQLRHKELQNVDVMREANNLRSRQGIPDPTRTIGTGTGEPMMADDGFKSAVGAMIQAIKDAEESGWRGTSKSTAKSYLEIFMNMLIIGNDARPETADPEKRNP